MRVTIREMQGAEVFGIRGTPRVALGGGGRDHESGWWWRWVVD